MAQISCWEIPSNLRSLRQPPVFSLAHVSWLLEKPSGHLKFMMAAVDRGTISSSAWLLHWTTYLSCNFGMFWPPGHGIPSCTPYSLCLFDMKTLSQKLLNFTFTKTLSGKAVMIISILYMKPIILDTSTLCSPACTGSRSLVVSSWFQCPLHCYIGCSWLQLPVTSCKRVWVRT